MFSYVCKKNKVLNFIYIPLVENINKHICRRVKGEIEFNTSPFRQETQYKRILKA